ncbi:hypothetical protein ABID80_003442 [Streptomyces sp. PvP037]
MSCRLPPVSVTAIGVPCRSPIRWCLEPGRARSTGEGPRGPPLRAGRAIRPQSSHPGQAGQRGAAKLGQQGGVQAWPDAGLGPVPRSAPGRHAGTAHGLRRDVPPCNTSPQHEQDASECCSVGNTQPSGMPVASFGSGWQQRGHPLPQVVRKNKISRHPDTCHPRSLSTRPTAFHRDLNAGSGVSSPDRALSLRCSPAEGGLGSTPSPTTPPSRRADGSGALPRPAASAEERRDQSGKASHQACRAGSSHAPQRGPAGTAGHAPDRFPPAGSQTKRLVDRWPHPAQRRPACPPRRTLSPHPGSPPAHTDRQLVPAVQGPKAPERPRLETSRTDPHRLPTAALSTPAPRPRPSTHSYVRPVRICFCRSGRMRQAMGQGASSPAQMPTGVLFSAGPILKRSVSRQGAGLQVTTGGGRPPSPTQTVKRTRATSRTPAERGRAVLNLGASSKNFGSSPIHETSVAKAVLTLERQY